MKTKKYMIRITGIFAVITFLATSSYSQQQMKINTHMQVLQQPVKAGIITDPADVYVCEGGSAMFFIADTGDAPITYQWLFNGTPLPFTNDTLILPVVSMTDAGEYRCVATNSCGSDTSLGAALTVYQLPVVYSISGNMAICPGSSAEVTIIGSDVGTDYELYLDGVATGSVLSGDGTDLTWTGLTATGQYTVIGINPFSLCTSQMNGFSVVSEYPLMTMSLVSSFDPTCFNACDGSYTYTATGSSGYVYDNGFSINGTGSFTALCDGNYTITVTDNNGCTDTDNITLTQPAEITINVTAQTGASCSGICDGTASIVIAGGTGSLSVTWSNGETSLNAVALCGGSNYVTVTDQNMCYTNLEVVTNAPPAYQVTETMTSPDCYNYSNGSISLAVSGSSPPYLYAWSDMMPHGSNATGLASGSFTITITDATMCDTIVTFFLPQPDTLIINEAIFDPSCYNNDGQIVTSPLGGNGGFVFIWSTSASTSDLTNVGSGTYSVTVTDVLGCSASDSFILNPTSINPVLKGQVAYSGGNFGAGEVEVKFFNEIDSPTGSTLYEYYSETMLTTTGFELQVAADRYIIRSVLVSPASYPGVFSTYYNGIPTGFTTNWEDAEALTLGCNDTMNIVINMDENPGVVTGTVSFAGTIYYWDSGGVKGITSDGDREVGEPVEGAEIFIEQQPNDEPIANTSSGTDGTYIINGIPEGFTYDMSVDIPGIPLISTYTDIFVGSGTTTLENLNFFVDTTTTIGGIFIDSVSGISIASIGLKYMSIYPNPSSDKLFVEVDAVSESDIRIVLNDISGKFVKEILNERNAEGRKTYEIKLNGIAKGNYILSATIGRDVFIRKFVIE